VVLLSGGLDSAVTLAWMRAGGFRCIALSFDYGQRHRFELACAERVAAALGAVEHRVAPIDLRAFGGSALTADIAVPKGRDVEHAHDIPVTYVPARNAIFLTMALGLAEVSGAGDIALGVNALDYSGYPDCRPAFVEAFERMANLGTKAGVEASERGARWLTVHTPLMTLNKAAIVRLGASLGVDFGLTSSCYDPGADGVPCGRCDSCQLRAKGFAEAGLRDARAG
jgi:7-cyano-7-deazaguanine synthase